MRSLPVLALAGIIGACNEASVSPVALPSDCSAAVGTGFDPREVPRCLWLRGILSEASRQEGDSILSVALRYVDSIGVPTTQTAFERASEVRRAVWHMSELYERGMLDDSARYNRILDHVAVTLEFVRGEITPFAYGNRYRPKRTPYLTWVYYPGIGLYFNPVTSVHTYEFNFAYSWTRTDSLTLLADAMYNYLVWHTADGRRFPLWEYEFSFNSGGVFNWPPWQSGMAQGLGLLIFTQLYQRTNDPKWRARAREVFESYRVTWDKMGVLLQDTTDGYWFEEYSPRTLIWNGSVLANIHLDYFARITENAEAARMAASGYGRIRKVTHLYDTGAWTLYSMTLGHNSVSYHQWHITLADTLYGRTGDTYWRDIAAKWRAYTPPAGVVNLLPISAVVQH